MEKRKRVPPPPPPPPFQFPITQISIWALRNWPVFRDHKTAIDLAQVFLLAHTPASGYRWAPPHVEFNSQLQKFSLPPFKSCTEHYSTRPVNLLYVIALPPT